MPQDILTRARKLYKEAHTWADFSNALFDPHHGLVVKCMPDHSVRAAFRKTDVYAELHRMVEQKMRQTGVVAGATPSSSTHSEPRRP